METVASSLCSWDMLVGLSLQVALSDLKPPNDAFCRTNYRLTFRPFLRRRPLRCQSHDDEKGLILERKMSKEMPCAIVFRSWHFFFYHPLYLLLTCILFATVVYHFFIYYLLTGLSLLQSVRTMLSTWTSLQGAESLTESSLFAEGMMAR